MKRFKVIITIDSDEGNITREIVEYFIRVGIHSFFMGTEKEGIKIEVTELPKRE